MVHFYKTYHILLNGDGAAVVSDGVFEGLKSAGAFAPSNPDRLEIESETTNPPKVVLGLGNGGMAPIPQRDEVVIYHE